MKSKVNPSAKRASRQQILEKSGLLKKEIAQLRQTEEDLLESQSWLDLALRGWGVVLWNWNLRTNEMSFPRYGKERLGYEDEEYPSHFEEWKGRLHPEDRGRVLDSIKKFVNDPWVDHTLEFRLRHKDGSYRWFLLRADFYTDADRRPVRMAGCMIDITERKRAEEKIQEVADLKSEFVSMVSHELRAPLAIVKEGVDIVLGGIAGAVNEKQKDLLGVVKRDVDRLARLVNGVLDYQKIESGGLQLHRVEGDLNEVARQVHQSFEPAAKGKGLALVAQLAEGLPLLKFDRDTITQVLTNFLNNAVKLTDKGTLTLRTARDENGVRVSVEDQGPGIRKEDLPKLFQSFSQIQGEVHKSAGGTGLGLAISKRIVEAHQGQIGVKSVYGQGSTFYFVLPIR